MPGPAEGGGLPGPAEGAGTPGPEETGAQPGSRWYTGRGDDGTTGLLGPGRVPKYDPRPEACGAVDEAQAAIGLARAAGCAPEVRPLLLHVQRDLSTLMAELAAAGTGDSPFSGQVTADHVAQLEEWLADVEAAIDPPRGFVLPGDTLPGAALHLARTVVRRAERESVRLLHSGLLPNPHVVRYLNRLSSLLFLLACAEDARSAL
jgi:cob(I)alamin adenosyltransferase